ncbi:hypothetical protein EMPS_00961 [Entomortierella parvispora]|uniref:Uncharacterized protein n=1 Tax=Entomortierella parvispora TaxID=205924 RepID=A0A9P3H220_9FUNG|nr:hypothetical protein EMPS_00961 [Entomortierella parvispora]
MAKKESEKKATTDHNAVSDASSQFSKETSSSGKNKGWARSLKKATNSFIYMAMPPTSVDNMPMVVAQTPMSPDRLIPSLHSPIFQSPLLTTSVTPTSMVVNPVTPSPLAPAASPFAMTSVPLDSSVSVTATSSSASVATSSIASSSKGHKESVVAESASTWHHRKQSSSSSNSSARAKRSAKGKERAVPLSAEVLNALEAPKGPLDYIGTNYSSSLVSPPSSPPSIRDIKDSFTAAALQTSLAHGIKDDNSETLPSPPPSPQHVKASKEVRQDKKKAKATPVDDLEFEALVQSALAESETLETTEEVTVEVKSREMVLPMFPADFSAFDLSLEIEQEKHGKSAPTKEAEAVAISSVQESKASQVIASVQGMRQDIVVAAMEELEIMSPPVIAESVTKDLQASTPMESTRQHVPEPLQLQPIQKQLQEPDYTRELTFNEPSKPLPSPPSLSSDKKIKSRNDAPVLSSIPSRSLSLVRSLSRDSSKPRPVKNAPWLWHQDGITHQRLESHQILTKEQVFEQFHLDLEQDGPNGFFLFKLVKRFKRQDSSPLGISSSLLDAEISASPSSSPPTYGSSSILDQIDAVSVSQKLKRQLLLQKRKKQRKASSTDMEEDENLEALLSMSNNNTSLQNLNSSLQDVLDAVDSLKETQDWASLLDHPLDHSRASSIYSQAPDQTPHEPDSDNEYTSREKDAMDGDALEKKRGVYATGRTDGMNLISKKKLKALERRASMSTATPRKGSSHSSAPVPTSSKNGSDHADSESAVESTGLQPFKKQAVSQLHIYSRNGLKFKFDVMQDNELHFVEASKKYTFMDPLAAHRQPDLDNNSQDALSPLRNSGQNPASLPPINGGARRTSSGQVSTTSTGSNDSKPPGPRRRNTQSSTASSGGGRRVFVTRLGRHSLLTYPEYKVLAKSASGFTLGAKLLIQRSIAVATPGFYGSSSNGQSNGHSREAASYGSDSEYSTVSTTNGSQAHSTPTPLSGAADSADYFTVKKNKSRGLTGLASKAVSAIKSPTTPSTPGGKTPRPIVTPYNPAEYKNKSLTVTVNATEDSLYTPTPSSGNRPSASGAMEIPWSESSSSPFPMPPGHPASPSSTVVPENYSSSPPSISSLPNPLPTPPTPSSATLSTPSAASSTSNPYNSLPIKRQGNQAGIKFQHLFVTVHQRLQKLELDGGASFYRSALVQWTVIEDVAELRWWRDKIGIQMIGRLEGDPWPTCSSASTLQNGHGSINSSNGGKDSNGSYTIPSTPSSFLNPLYSSTLSVRSSYLSAQSTISDASSSSSLSVAMPPGNGGYQSKVSVERLGYRFLRVSGHMGTMKVTVSEQVEARAVALAVKAEMLKQKKKNQLQDGVYQEPAADEFSEIPWVEVQDVFDEEGEESLDDDDDENLFVVDNEDEDEKWGVEGGGVPIKTLTTNKVGDVYEYNEWTGEKMLRKTPGEDRFSRRKRHDRAAAKAKRDQKMAKKHGAAKGLKQQGPLIERMTMIVGQAKVFKGDWYMKNIYKSY